MILFKKLTYKNFKAVGNHAITIDLNTTKTTLVTGKNGAGKSTITSAICFNLFGEDFVLNKPGLINSINQKQLLTELEFSIGAKEYKVVRGIKPNIFKIYESSKPITAEDKPMNEDAASRDYQKILETQILKMDIRAFKQVVVVGGRSYTPFMKLKVADRREFIEDLLDIRVFSTMGGILKDKVKRLKEELKENDEELKTIQEKVALQKAFVEKLSNEKSVSIAKIESGIAVLESDNDVHYAESNKLVLEESKLIAESEPFANASSDLVSLKYELNTLNKAQDKLSKSIEFYSHVTECPTCTQAVSQEHKDKIIETTSLELDACLATYTTTEGKMLRAEKILKQFNEKQKEIIDVQLSISTLQRAISSNNHLILRSRQQIDEMNSDSTSIDVEKVKLAEFAKKWMSISENKKKLLESQQYNEFMQQSLADSGIKSKIIKHYIPTINKYINKYLADLDFFVLFNLDETFEETIKSRHRDNFKYDNFSDGQKARIDLALMFAWRDIAKLRNAVNTNLLFLDEIDKEVDGEGSSLLSELLNKIEKSSIFIISHKGDLLRDKVERSIEFELRNNFSELVKNH
jgi:DNA repair exonuclease SbcCD ATPase subunit